MERNVDADSYTFDYDVENHITEVNGDASVEYTYNGDGQMVIGLL